MPSDIDELLEYLRGDKQQVANRLSFEAYEFRLRREQLQAGTFARWIAAGEELRTLRAGDVVTLPACRGTITKVTDPAGVHKITPIIVETTDGDPTNP